MITRATESDFCTSSWIGSTVGTPVCRGFSGAGVVEALSFAVWLFSGRNTLARGSDTAQGLADGSADFRRLEGGRDETSRPPCCALSRSGSFGGQGYKKGWLDGGLLPITLPMTVGLGGNATGCIKCPGSRTHVRRRAALLRSRPTDSHELVSVFDGHRSVEP